MAKAKAVKTKKAPAPKSAKTPPPPKKLPTVAVKPKKATAPSLPLPPPPPPPPAQRDELLAPRDIARLLRYGEKFGAKKIDIRMLQLQLPAATAALAICDPMVPKTWKVFDRPVVPGVFRVMVSAAKDEAGKEQLAAIVVHVGRPPIAKWTVAHWQSQKKPKSADKLPMLASTSGWIALLDAGDGSPGTIAMPPTPSGTMPVEVPLTDGRRALALPCGAGEYTAYWAVDATDKPICLVVDFDVFTQKEWKAKPSS